MALYRQDSTGFLVDLPAPASGYTAISAMPSDLPGRVEWWRDLDVDEALGQSSSWHPMVQSAGEDPFPVTDPRAGSGVNVLNARYTYFDHNSGLPFAATNCTQGYGSPGIFGTFYVTLQASSANGECWFGASSADWNIQITKERKWIFSFFCAPFAAPDASKQFWLLAKTGSGGTRAYPFTTGASGFQRFSTVIDFSSDASTTGIFGFRIANSGIKIALDGLMMEEQVGPYSTPSAFSAPPNTIDGGQIDPGTVTGGSGGQIGSGTITDANIANLTVTGAKIANATISSAKISDLSADKITTGTISGKSITLDGSSSVIKSSDYVAGVSGWRIQGDGVAEFSEAIIRGSLNASDITAGTLNIGRIGDGSITGTKIANATIGTAKIVDLTVDKLVGGTITGEDIILSGGGSYSQIRSSNYVGGVSGWRIIGNGDAEFRNVTVRGNLDATDLTAGTINGARYGDGTITDSKIVSLTANKITAGTINAATITVTNLNASNLTVGTINGSRFGTDTIGGGPIIGGAIHAQRSANISSASVPSVNNAVLTSGSYWSSGLSIPANSNRSGVLLIASLQPTSTGGFTFDSYWYAGFARNTTSSALGFSTMAFAAPSNGSIVLAQGGTISFWDSGSGTSSATYYVGAQQYIQGSNKTFAITWTLIEFSKA